MKRTVSLMSVLLLASMLLCGCTQTPNNPDLSNTSDTPVTTDTPQSSPISDFEYEITENGTIIKKYIGTTTHVNIPTQIEGADVIELASGCFEKSAVECVSLPESVQIIGAAAFMNCTKLSTVILPEKMDEIRSKAFENCTSLIHIVLPYGNLFRNCQDVFLNAGLESVEFRGGIEILAPNTFAGTKLKEMVLPSGVREIEMGALACPELEVLVLNKDLETIHSGAFETNGKLTEIVIPASVTTVSEFAFRGCTVLTKVKFEGNAPTLSGQDEILQQVMKDLYPDYPNFTVYYHEDAEGFTDPLWDKFQKELW